MKRKGSIATASVRDPLDGWSNRAILACRMVACVGLRTYKFPLKAVCSTALAERTPGGAIHYPWENIRRSTNASTASSRSQFPQGTNPRPALIASSKDSGAIIHTYRLLGLA
uniref:Uncharacterized protein n=1 Tax=Coccidioides posadasii RMSCC 3488 TaxID=454284 RepID=A0A0J6FJK6_COCPO|nr:hypothetical protein CPAG_06814 [Coccidioides posadasii RMSCC 3488]